MSSIYKSRSRPAGETYYDDGMNDADLPSAEDLLPAVYADLRRLAARQLRSERPNHSLSPTGLVHEAWLRLQGPAGDQVAWNSRGHFFGAAAQAMRRILVDHARKRKAAKRGGGVNVTLQLEAELAAAPEPPAADLLSLDQALTALEQHNQQLAELVSLRYFAGVTMQQAADLLGVSLRTAERNWTYARAWLQVNIEQQGR